MAFSDSIPLLKRAPRTSLWLCIAVVLLAAIAVVSPVQLPVVLYKVALISLAAVAGYWLDRALFPYSRPDGYLCRDWRLRRRAADEGHVDFPVVPGNELAFVAAMLRRALIVGAAIIGIALGL